MANLARERGSDFNVWVACNDIDVEGNWTCDWQEGSPPFMGWHPDQPDDTISVQNCAVISSFYSDSMDDLHCTANIYAFCVCQVVSVCQSTRPRSHCYGNILNSGCLLDHVIREFRTGSVTICASACVIEPGCRSFNFKRNDKEEKWCQLNNSTRSEDMEKFQDTSYFCIYSDACLD